MCRAVPCGPDHRSLTPPSVSRALPATHLSPDVQQYGQRLLQPTASRAAACCARLLLAPLGRRLLLLQLHLLLLLLLYRRRRRQDVWL